MGVDGDQTLQIRGPDIMLDSMEETGLLFDTEDPELLHIGKRFFGKDQIKIKHRSPKYLVVSYEYRNLPVYQYLSALLQRYPKCWMKNEFFTDQGICGVWIARMTKGQINEQEQAWTELCYEEILMGEDFSTNI